MKRTKTAAGSAAAKAKTPRRVKPPEYKRFQLRGRVKYPDNVASGWQITKKTARLLWQNKNLFLGIALVYGLLNLILVRGLGSSVDVNNLKETLNHVFSGQYGQLASSLSVFAVLLGSSGAGASGSANVYQFFLVIIVSLAIIWSLRQLLTGAKIRVRDGFYLGMYPLVPFILVLFVVGLQLLPMLIGADVYSIILSNGIAVTFIEKFACLVVLILLVALSLYWLSSSVFALYIVTLPEMTPLKALRSARELVRFRRWTLLRKILFLPLILLIAAAVIMVPVIILIAPVAQWVFFALATLAIVAVHGYMYTLYRELL
jgi:hypothetical protein